MICFFALDGLWTMSVGSSRARTHSYIWYSWDSSKANNEASELSHASNSRQYQLLLTKTRGNPDVAGNLILASTLLRLQILSFGSFFVDFCPGERNLEHASSADKPIPASSLSKRISQPVSRWHHGHGSPLTIKKYVSGCCWGVCEGKISEPFRSFGRGARRWAYSKDPRFSGRVAFEVPICVALTARCVLPRRRRPRSSSSGRKKIPCQLQIQPLVDNG